MSKPLSNTARRYANRNEQELDTLLCNHATAIRMGLTDRAEMLMVKINEVRATIAANKAKVAARSEARRQASRDKWFQEQMDKARAGLR